MRIVFIGTGEIGVPTLQALLKSEQEIVGVVTQPDKPVGRAQLVEPPPIKKVVAATKMPVLQPPRIKDPRAIEDIRALKPDVIGITVMYVDEGLDTGDILLQRTIDIVPADTGGSLHDGLAKVAPEALRESLELLAKASASRIPQDNAFATYAPKLKREDGRIDWSDPAEAIERKIRAFNPWPGAFMAIKANGTRNLKIFSAEVVDVEGRPGEILRSQNELVVAAGKRALSLRKVQLEGKQRMSAAEFLRGHTSITRVTG